MIRRGLLVSLLFGSMCGAQVTLHPGDNVPKIVASKPAGTTFIFSPGLYRLSQPIMAKDNDKFVGESSCAPPANSCPAILTGSVEVGSLAKPDGSNFAVPRQNQQGGRGGHVCDPEWDGCKYPEDLFIDEVPLRHLDSPTMPNISSGEWWFDYANHVIYFHDDPAGHKVETSVVNTAFGGPANNLTIQYLTVQEFAGMYPVGAIGIYHGKEELNQGVNWTIEHCDIKLNHSFGVRANYRIHVLNNYIHDNGQLGIGGGVAVPSEPEKQAIDSGILIMGNTISHNNYAHFNPGFGAGGIKVGSTSGIVIRGNTIQNNEGSGVHFDEDCKDELVDGNLITDNSDGDGLVQEIGGASIFRNNIVARNGAHLNSNNWAYQIGVRASSGVHIYCNVIEVPPSTGGVGAWVIGAAPRGSSHYPPFQYHATAGNSFHHNTVIWDADSNGGAGFHNNDPQNQPNFFASNTPPDYNEYHMPNPSKPQFLYDNDNSKTNRAKPFSAHQRSHADVHSTADNKYNKGFPKVAITSPADESQVQNPVTISATASDEGGIKKVEFYVDWKLAGTVTNPPYDFNWNDGNAGSHTVAAMAYSNAGIRACYAVTLNEQ